MPRILAAMGESKPWGDVIAASFIVMLVTLSGVFFFSLANVIRCVHGRDFDPSFWFKFNNIVIPAFGCGTLLATAVFIIIPEALMMLGEGSAEESMHAEETDLHADETEEEHEDEHGHGNEVAIAWKFGASLLGGFLLPCILGGFFLHSHHHMTQDDVQKLAADRIQRDGNVDIENDDGNDDTDQKSPDALEQKKKDWGLIISILLGDGLHNFCDGVFIGTGFLLCSRSFAYTIVASTVFHEVVQEVSDYALLVDFGGLNTFEALFLNFLSSTSVLVGSLLVLGIEPSNTAIGSILSISSGTFLYIAACECIPRVQKARCLLKDTGLFLLFFLLGAVPIGLVLLNHKHCEASH